MKLPYYCFLFAGFLLTGCAATPESTPETTPPQQVSTTHHESMTAAPSAFHDMVWQWQNTKTAHGEILTPTHPERYTIQFGRDQRLSVTADCNRGVSEYRVDGQQIKLLALAMTRVMCFGESQADVFLAGVNAITRFRFHQGVLELELSDGGIMRFTAPATPR